MKKLIYIAASVLLIAGLGWAYYAYASYLPTYSRSVAESILIDQTEQFLVQPTGKEILAPADLPGHKWESVLLQVRTFSEYKYTERHSLSLPGGFFLLGNPDARDKDIRTFSAQVDSVVSAINGQNKGCQKSSIYAPFIEEVNRLANTKADIRNAVSYSDLCENTSVFSIYRERDRNLLIQHPDKVKELLSRYGKPGNLHGLTVYIVFKPKNSRDDENFTLMASFYKQLFETAGATVHIAANLVMDNK